MGFFDDLGKKLSDASQDVMQKGKEMADTAKFNAQIHDEEKKISAVYSKIGKKYFEVFENAPSEDFKAFIDEIHAAQAKIAEIQEKLNALKNEGKDAVENAAADAKEAVNQAAEKVENAAEGAADAAKQVADHVENAAEQAVNKAEDAVDKGVSVGLAAAGVYVLAVLGNYTAILLAVGYIFLMEEDAWLKKSAVKALATMLCFSFLLSLLGLVPDAFKWIGTALSVVNVNDGTRVITAFWSLITQAIDIFKTCIFLALAFKALNQSTITVPVVDELLNKHFDE